ncbi:hypothetical protein U9M48_019200 [Paspalum notatum var. saurae]|uniref:Uncharacterized protein n=1 Tax=Paspalum notatum var. saurae TaxID=547442 RepID=A0AAQ3WRA1_PASNO
MAPGKGRAASQRQCHLGCREGDCRMVALPLAAARDHKCCRAPQLRGIVEGRRRLAVEGRHLDILRRGGRNTAARSAWERGGLLPGCQEEARRRRFGAGENAAAAWCRGGGPPPSWLIGSNELGERK